MENQNTVGGQFKALNIIHAAICTGVLIALCLFRYLVKKDPSVKPEANLVIEIAGVSIAFLCVLAARFLFFIRTKPALSVSSLGEKINIFRSAFIVQLALLDGAAIINAAFYYLNKNDIHFFIALGVLLLMIFRRPTRVMAAMVLFNSNEDLQQIYEDDLPV